MLNTLRQSLRNFAQLAVGHENVSRGQIPVDEALLLHVGHAFSDLVTKSKQVAGRRAPVVAQILVNGACALKGRETDQRQGISQRREKSKALVKHSDPTAARPLTLADKLCHNSNAVTCADSQAGNEIVRLELHHELCLFHERLRCLLVVR